jgi:hypothetical protein
MNVILYNLVLYNPQLQTDNIPISVQSYHLRFIIGYAHILLLFLQFCSVVFHLVFSISLIIIEIGYCCVTVTCVSGY